MPYVCYKWKEAATLWKAANWKWSECKLVIEIVGGPGEKALPQWLWEEVPYDPYAKEKRKRFIRLLAKVKGYPDFDKQKEIRDDIKITVEDVRMVVKAVLGIDLKVEKEDLNYGLLPIHRQK